MEIYPGRDRRVWNLECPDWSMKVRGEGNTGNSISLCTSSFLRQVQLQFSFPIKINSSNIFI
jgi:hypothetical protein